jgi:hypothetical protein
MIAIHPMTQMLEEIPWRNQVARELGLPAEIQWILRLGYLKSYPDPVSLRMPFLCLFKSKQHLYQVESTNPFMIEV